MSTNDKSFAERFKEASMTNQPVVTMLTDFGTVDGFVGVMKGVLLQISPNARIVDVTHDLPPFSVSAAAFLNEWSYGYFPAGSVHLCVVDPGVGTHRRVLAAELDGHRFVAPDNGLLTPILKQPGVKVHQATNDRFWLDKVSNTFHGRDVFSPVAAYLANGVSLADMGEAIGDPIRLQMKQPDVQRETIECRVCYIDRFGNLITDLDQKTFRDWMLKNDCDEKDVILLFQDQCIEGLSRSYAENKQGDLLAVFNGYDRLEIAVAGGSAAATTGLGLDAPIKICVSWAA